MTNAPAPQAAKITGRTLPPIAFLPFGALFGFVLSRAGATTYDYYAGLFLFSHLQLLWVIAAGAATGAVFIAIMKRMKTKAVLTGDSIDFTGKPFTKELVPGALVLGVGWGLAGACPGTVLTMLGEGKLNALFTIGGIVVGTWLYGVVKNASQGKAPSAGDSHAPAA
ncbi:MAG: YeeE/YedE family protein [Myxococcales bacterium]|nr:YeeE/YedE family protein [Myxococcales bacterium]